MKKLHLDLDSLCVESFGTGAGSAGGTVNGHVFDAAAGTGHSIIDDSYQIRMISGRIQFRWESHRGTETQRKSRSSLCLCASV